MSVSMRVTVWGPNLSPGPKDDKSTIHVHAAGCADTKRGMYLRTRVTDSDTVEATSVQQVVWDIYPPDNFEYDEATEWEDYAADIRFFPCTDALPYLESAQAEA